MRLEVSTGPDQLYSLLCSVQFPGVGVESKPGKRFIPEATHLHSQGQRFLTRSGSPGVNQKAAATGGMDNQLFISSMYILI